MAVRTITGRPGMGKTLELTVLALSCFKDDNRKVDQLASKIKDEDYIWVNNIYSNYPILLKEDKNKMLKYIDGSGQVKESHQIYSNVLRFTDMRLKWRFSRGASFFIDEVQFVYDSSEYKLFPDCIAHFFQIHRHLGYNMIYTNSQSISRIIKKILVVTEEYWDIIDYKCYFGKLCRVDFRISYDLISSNETSAASRMNEDENVDYYRKWFFSKKPFNAYDTKYLGELNENLPVYNRGQWTSKRMTREQIMDNFIITQNEKDDLVCQEF